MAAAVNDPTEPATPEQRALRQAKIVRAALLFIVGAVIAFTATLHRELGFDRLVVAVSLVLFALAHLNEWFRAARAKRDAPLVLLAAAALLAALGMLLVSTPEGFALSLAVWAIVAGLLEFIASALGAGKRQDALFMGVLGVLLALALLVFRDDPVAALGFFGAYAIIAGVYLGIAAFDQRSPGRPGDAARAHTPAANAPAGE